VPEIGRNDPCPCGSGKKYKRCCLLVRAEEERAVRVLSGGFGRALDWLFEAHGPAMQAAIERDFFAAGRDGIQQLFAGL
jgi:predicted ATPase with chaperone activity